MKRLGINSIAQKADDYIHRRGFFLPPFAYGMPEVWEKKGPEVSEKVDNKLGWDITDFGKGNFIVFETREMKYSMMELALVFSPGETWIDAGRLVFIEHRRRQA